MRVLGVSSYPVEAAATRFRMAQYVGPLREHGIELTIKPFLDGPQFREFYANRGLARKVLQMVGPVSRRIAEVFEAGKYDLLFVQREAALFGPGIFERLYQRAGKLPMVLDLDDATYVPYVSPSFGRLGSYLKFFGKTDGLIKQADLVICGNRFIAEYAGSKGARTAVIPTVVDTDIFKPVPRSNPVPVIGWIGTHSTFPFLQSLFPVLEKLAEQHRFRLKIVGGSKADVHIPGVDIENLDWNLEREIADFQGLDIGLYPITTSASANEEWIKGKSGFKAVQYLSVGVPFVMSPVGVCAEIGIDGVTHFAATADREWYDALDKLLSSAELRRSFGEAGRNFAVDNFSLAHHAGELAARLKETLGRSRA